MPKDTEYNKINNLMLVVSFNQRDLDSEDPSKLQPVRIEARADVKTAEGASMRTTKILNIGTPVKKPLTNKQIYTKISGFNSQLGILVKDLVLKALNEDVSVIE